MASSGPSSEFQVRLFRDSLSTPWGFRLQGGRDFNQPLTIQRVFVGSPAEGELHRGDVVLVLDNNNASQLIHKDAQDIVKRAGGQLLLWILRGNQRGQLQKVGQSSRTPPASATPFSPTFPKPPPPLFNEAPKPSPPVSAKPAPQKSSKPKPPPLQTSYAPQATNMGTPQTPTSLFGVKIPTFNTRKGPSMGTDFSKKSLGRQLSDDRQMMDRVGESLSGLVLQQPSPYQHPQQKMDDVDNYEVASVRDRKQMFQPKQQAQPRRGPGKRVTIKTDPKYELGWTPGSSSMVPAPPKPQYYPSNYNPSTADPPVSERTEPIAWEGSLRQAGSIKPWDVTDDSFGPALHSTDRKPGPWVPPKPSKPVVAHKKQVVSRDQADGPRVVHLQYNTPLQMYSRDNAEETLEGQTAGQPGAGSMKIHGGNEPAMDITKSPTYQFLHYDKKAASQPHSTRYEETPVAEQPQYKGYIDQNRQSLAFKTLQKITNTDDDAGVSDF